MKSPDEEFVVLDADEIALVMFPEGSHDVTVAVGKVDVAKLV